MTARRVDWIERLWSVLEGEAARREFAYGGCVRLAAECVEAMTGVDHRERCALLAAAAHDGVSLDQLEREATELLGEPVPMGLARRGDVVLVDLPSGPALAVCTGDKLACAALPAGIAYLNRNKGLKAWRVGE